VFINYVITFNPDYALENLLRAETSSKHNALPLFLLHHSGYYASVKKVSVLLSFQLSLRFLMLKIETKLVKANANAK
jgi:hypothetical protein